MKIEVNTKKRDTRILDLGKNNRIANGVKEKESVSESVAKELQKQFKRKDQ